MVYEPGLTRLRSTTGSCFAAYLSRCLRPAPAPSSRRDAASRDLKPSMMPHSFPPRLPKLTALALPLMLLASSGAANAEDKAEDKAQVKVEVKTELWDGQRAMGNIGDLLRFTP